MNTIFRLTEIFFSNTQAQKILPCYSEYFGNYSINTLFTKNIKTKEVLYIRWNECHLKTEFETLMPLLQTGRFLRQVAFLCETDLVIKICYFMIATRNAKNLRKYKTSFSLIVEQILWEAKNLSPSFKQTAWQCFMLLNIVIWIVRRSIL